MDLEGEEGNGMEANQLADLVNQAFGNQGNAGQGGQGQGQGQTGFGGQGNMEEIAITEEEN